jgi:hypothetical protein
MGSCNGTVTRSNSFGSRGDNFSPRYAMSMVCERGWGGEAADSDSSVLSPHPHLNGIRKS